MQDTTKILCPYCGEINEIYIDYSGGTVQSYVEDCQICCRPWNVRVEIFEEEPVVNVTRSDE